MAEKVQIEGGGDFDGAILKNAATEATLDRLATAMEEKQKGLKDKILGMGTKVIEGNIHAQKESTTAFGSFNQTLNSGTKAGKELTDTFAKIVGTGVGATFSLLTTAGNAFLGFVKDGYTAFEESARVGAAFNNNLFELRRAAVEAQMPLNEFTELIQKNSETFARMGLTVTDGAKTFSEMAGALKDRFGDALVGAGISLTDMNEGLTSYLEIQSRLNKIDTRNTKAITEGTAAYLMELDKVTKLTGMNRKAAEEAARKASVDPVIKSMLEETKGNAQKFNAATANMALIQEVGGEQGLQMFKELAARNPSAAAARFAQAFDISMEEAREVFTGGIVPEQLVKKLKAGAERAKELGVVSGEYAEALMSRDPGFEAVARFANSISQLGDLDAARREQENREKVTEGLGVFSRVLNKIYFNTMAKIVDSPVFVNLVASLEKLADKFIENSPKIVEFFDSVFSAVNKAMDNFISNVDKEGIGGAIMDFFKDLFTYVGKVIGPILTESVSSLFGESAEQKKQKEAFRNATPEEKEKMRQQNPDIDKQQTGMLGGLADGLKSLTNLVPSLTDLAKFFGVTGVGAVVAGTGISFGISLVSKGLQSLVAPAVELSLPVGVLAAALWGLSKATEAAGNMLDKLSNFFHTMKEASFEDLGKAGGALLTFSASLAQIGTGGILNVLGAGGLDSFFVTLQRAKDIDVAKLTQVGPALSVLAAGLKEITGVGITDSVSGAISTVFSSNSLNNVIDLVSKINKIEINEVIVNSIATISQALSTFNNLTLKVIDITPIKDTVNALNIGDINVEPINKIIESLSKFNSLNFSNVDISPIKDIDETVNKIKNINFDQIASIPVEKIVNSLSKFNKLNFSNINLSPVTDLVNTLDDFETIDTTTIQSTLEFIKQSFESYQINPSNIDNAVSAIGKLKTTMSEGFNFESKGVEEFTKSITTLVSTLEKLETQMKKTPTTVGVAENVNAKALGPLSGGDISGNSPEDLQRQLNMKIDELISHIVDMKQNTKDTADSLSDRRSAI